MVVHQDSWKSKQSNFYTKKSHRLRNPRCLCPLPTLKRKLLKGMWNGAMLTLKPPPKYRLKPITSLIKCLRNKSRFRLLKWIHTYWISSKLKLKSRDLSRRLTLYHLKSWRNREHYSFNLINLNELLNIRIEIHPRLLERVQMFLRTKKLAIFISLITLPYTVSICHCTII